MRNLIFAAAIMTAGCASSEDDAPKVSASQWKLCWSLCGKGDKLIAATPTDCLCKGGYRVKTDVPPPVEEPTGGEPFDLWLWLGFK